MENIKNNNRCLICNAEIDIPFNFCFYFKEIKLFKKYNFCQKHYIEIIDNLISELPEGQDLILSIIQKLKQTEG